MSDVNNIVQKKELSTAEAGRLIGRTSQGIIHWCNANKIRYSRVGTGPRRVDTVAFREYLISNGINVDGFTDTPLVFDEDKLVFSAPKIKKTFSAKEEIPMPLTHIEKVKRLKKIIQVLQTKDLKPDSKYRSIEDIITSVNPL